MGGNLENLTKLSSLVYNLAATIAILVAAVWAWYRFIIKRERKPNLIINADASFVPYSEDLQLLTVNIHLKNIGSVLICPSSRGCWFSLRSLPLDRTIGQTPHWNDGAPIIEDYDVIINSNPDYSLDPKEENYSIEPGADFVETVNVVVPEGSLLMAQIGFAVNWEVGIYKVWQVLRQMLKGLKVEEHEEDEWEVWIYKVWQAPQGSTETSNHQSSDAITVHQ